MKIALVSMPWSLVEIPTPEVGRLAAMVRTHRNRDDVVCKYAYLDVAWGIGLDLYVDLANLQFGVASSLIYAAILHPERRGKLEEYFLSTIAPIVAANLDAPSQAALLHSILDLAEQQLDVMTQELAESCDVVTAIASDSQLFASLCLSRRLKEISPSIRVVLAGWEAGIAGTALREIYPTVDDVICGDLEWQFLELLDRIDAGEPPSARRGEGGPLQQPTCKTMVGSLDELPPPDYREYAEAAENYGSMDWAIPIEGSRGCWWDRVARTKNPMDCCHFCPGNGSTYRPKTPEQVAREMELATEQLGNFQFYFIDSALRRQGAEALLTAIRQSRFRYSFFYEIRAGIHPEELLMLRDAGCQTVQIGVEGLSTTYLRRLGKGTTTIQNLQTMKVCYELGITQNSNLLVGFPGATQEEVDETAENIRIYACIYQPLCISNFSIIGNCAVYQCPEEFSISNVRNHVDYELVVPDEVVHGMRLPHASFESTGPIADWSPVLQAIEEWRELRKRIAIRTALGEEQSQFCYSPLYYEDHGGVLDLFDRRSGYRHIELESVWREVYLYCMETKSVEHVIRRFGSTHGESTTNDVIEGLENEKLMFAENGKCLSLAVATFPYIAEARIRASRIPDPG